MESKTKKLKVSEVSVNMNSDCEGSVCFKFEKTEEIPAPYYVFIGTEETLRNLERRLKVESVSALKGKTVVALVHYNRVVGIALDSDYENVEGTSVVTAQLVITSISYTGEALSLAFEATNSEQMTYKFLKGSYALKAFMVDMGVVSVEELIGKTVTAYMEGNNIVYLTNNA